MEDIKPDPQPAANVEARPDERAPTGAGPSTNSGTPTNPGPTDAKPERQSGKSAEKQSAPPAEGLTEEKKAEPQPEPKLDPQVEALVKAQVEARLKSVLESALESKMDALLEVNRQLAVFLSEQMEIAIKLRQSVVAMEQLIESDARRKSKYAAMLEKVKGEGDGMPDPHWINRTRGMLSQLMRTGTTGPRIQGETSQR